jgi:hypothetical protein
MMMADANKKICAALRRGLNTFFFLPKCPVVRGNGGIGLHDGPLPVPGCVCGSQRRVAGAKRLTGGEHGRCRMRDCLNGHVGTDLEIDIRPKARRKTDLPTACKASHNRISRPHEERIISLVFLPRLRAFSGVADIRPTA